MSAKNLFRCLVALSLVLVAMPAVLTQSPGQVPEDWKTLLEWNGNGSFLADPFENRWLLLGLGIPVVLVALATQIGMFFFWRFARPAYALLAAAFVLLTPFWGISVLLPVEAALWELSLLLEGAIIALSYSQPFSSSFEA